MDGQNTGRQKPYDCGSCIECRWTSTAKRTRAKPLSPGRVSPFTMPSLGQGSHSLSWAHLRGSQRLANHRRPVSAPHLDTKPHENWRLLACGGTGDGGTPHASSLETAPQFAQTVASDRDAWTARAGCPVRLFTLSGPNSRQGPSCCGRIDVINHPSSTQAPLTGRFLCDTRQPCIPDWILTTSICMRVALVYI